MAELVKDLVLVILQFHTTHKAVTPLEINRFFYTQI